MTRLKCPRCATIIDVAPGVTPVCPNCGFGSASQPASPGIAPATSTHDAAPTFAPSPPPPPVDTDAVSPAAPAPAAPAKSAAKAWGWTLYGVGLLVLAVRIAVATLYLDSPSYEMADAGLVLVNFAIIVASAFLVYFDAKRLGVGRLHLAKVKLSSTDRTTPGSWAIVVFLLWIATMPWYLAIRGRLVQRVQLADQVGYFNTPKEAKAARKAHKKLEDGTPFPV